MGKLRIQALGTAFTIQSEEDEEYLNKLFGYYKKITDEVSQISSIKTPLQIAILSGMMICDELYKEKQNKVALENGTVSLQVDTDNQTDFFDAEEIEQRTLDMISKIDQVL